MTSSDPRGWIDKLVGAAMSVLVAALALYIAAQLVAAVWTILVACVAVAAVIGLAILVLRSRSGGW
ncbi:MAG: hypothetical protein QOE23_1290 [Pseudonocardiales bacterium]|nr:hypothetical protein [Pseudonocardiales bacterium]